MIVLFWIKCFRVHFPRILGKIVSSSTNFSIEFVLCKTKLGIVIKVWWYGERKMWKYVTQHTNWGYLPPYSFILRAREHKPTNPHTHTYICIYSIYISKWQIHISMPFGVMENNCTWKWVKRPRVILKKLFIYIPLKIHIFELRFKCTPSLRIKQNIWKVCD